MKRETLLSSAVVAIGIFASSMFKNQLAAAVLAGMMVVTALLAWMMADITDPPFDEIFSTGALFNKHFVPFQEGTLSTQGSIYYASITMLFLMLSAGVLEGRRWE